MADKSIEVQYQVRQNVAEIQDELRNIKKFEEEMKEKEQKIRENMCTSKQEKRVSIPIRSNVDEFSKFSEESINKMMKMSVSDEDDLAQDKRIANEYKERGSKFFKSKDYENAIKMYSSAIATYNQDSIYYSNRSQCYINLEKFSEAIDDANKAIKLDSKSQKPYYRRTIAYEKIGENINALKSCQEWMEVLPDDQLAKSTYDRIHNKIIENNKEREKEKIKWSKYPKKTNFIEKSSHLQSNKLLMKVPIQMKKSHSPIPDDIIDKLFNNNTGEHVAEIETDSKLFKSNFLQKTFNNNINKPSPVRSQSLTPKEKTKVNETNEILKASSSNMQEKITSEIPSIEDLELLKTSYKNFSLPTSGPQFYQSWKEMSDNMKFIYLKTISENSECMSIGMLIGAQLDSNLLSEIIHIIYKYFLHFKINYIHLLDELRKNSELTILALFMENDDKNKLNELLNLSSQDNVNDHTNNEIIKKIKNSFQI
ncbi:hypothetical protein PVAND_006616 [Polypedilum vanderplanki]|uniref:RNA polymerase II-associated protein 3 n=1 Tax=Polypedilum vanderplanki TaxID=319348 RepID=A0A9J6C4N4_POLVA|nr:hypothetical protein PVAND_006616 [Polypedilum vanderplanki]